MSTTLFSIAIFLTAVFGYIYYQNSQVPVLGVSQGKFKALSVKPNNVSSQTELPEKKVDPLPFKETQTGTMAALKKAVAAYGGGSIEKETDEYLYVIFTTPMMRFHDDVEFWLDANNKEVHFRSASRAGYSDMGLNRQRYDELSKRYQVQD